MLQIANKLSFKTASPIFSLKALNGYKKETTWENGWKYKILAPLTAGKELHLMYTFLENIKLKFCHGSLYFSKEFIYAISFMNKIINKLLFQFL